MDAIALTAPGTVPPWMGGTPIPADPVEPGTAVAVLQWDLSESSGWPEVLPVRYVATDRLIGDGVGYASIDDALEALHELTADQGTAAGVFATGDEYVARALNHAFWHKDERHWGEAFPATFFTFQRDEVVSKTRTVDNLLAIVDPWRTVRFDEV